MRDVHRFQQLNIATYRRYVNGGSVQYVGVGTRTSYRSQRADIVVTTPYKDGTYYIPTEYTAYFHSQHVRPGYAYWLKRNRLQPFNPAFYIFTRDEWGASERASNSVSLETLGVTSQLKPKPSLVGLSVLRETVLQRIRDTDLNLGQFLREAPEVVSAVGQVVKTYKNLSSSLARLLTKHYRLNPNTAIGREWFKTASVRDITRVLTQGHGGFNVSDQLNPTWVKRSLDRAFAQERRYTSPTKAAAAVAQWHLWYIYGVKPVVQDAYGIVHAAEEASTQPQAARAFHKMLDPEFGIGKGDFKPAGTFTYSGKANLWLQCSVSYKLENPTMFELWRYGLLNPASILWETTSLSFVLDWFTGIGSFIGALDTNLALSFESGYETYFTDLLYTQHDSAVYHNDAVQREEHIEGMREMDTTVQTIAMWRVLSLTFPIPLVYLRMNLNSNQVRSLIALVAAQF